MKLRETFKGTSDEILKQLHFLGNQQEAMKFATAIVNDKPNTFMSNDFYNNATFLKEAIRDIKENPNNHGYSEKFVAVLNQLINKAKQPDGSVDINKQLRQFQKNTLQKQRRTKPS